MTGVRWRHAFVVLLLLIVAVPVGAQTAEPAVRALLHNVTRVEAWSFFEPPDGGGDPDYTLAGNRARLAVQVETSRFLFDGAFQYSQLVGLPDDAIGPGPLGPGALYFYSAGTPQAFQLYFKSMSLRLKNVLPRLSLQFGRMIYQSGENTPFAGRLIGGADWTPFERAFDGARLDYQRAAWRAHASFVMPTQGAYEESASPTIGKLQLATVALHTPAVELFAHNYRDMRAVRARPDNTGLTADAVDVNIQTVGASAVVNRFHLWGAWQTGDWYGNAHHAFSVSADGGHVWSDARWRPTVRGGLLYASGDANPNDDHHGTFFPMIPTTQPDVLRGTYAQMNLRDLYARVTVFPRQRLQLGGEVHYLSLADHLDRWYSGTGATAFDGEYFGYSTRRSTLQRALGTYVQLSANTTINSHWTLGVSTGVVRGGDVVRRQFAGHTLFVMAIENTISLP
jgi:hypothetical protein